MKTKTKTSLLRIFSFIFICSLMLMLSTSVFMTINFQSSDNSDSGSIRSINKYGLKVSGTYNDITIDDLPGSLNNWTWAKTQPWCTGTGTLQDPYVIESHLLNVENINQGICISNSHDKYFIIRNCTFRWDGNMMLGFETGVKLTNTTKGKIYNNLAYGLPNCIYLVQSENIIVTNNTVYSAMAAIYLYESNSSQVYENTAYSNEIGISLSLSNHNSIYNNTVYSNTNGIQVSNSKFNEFYENIAYNNDDGIYLWVSENNTIAENSLSNNYDYGIEMNNGHNNTISENLANDNTQDGIHMVISHNNTITKNTINDNNNTGRSGIFVSNSKDNIISGNGFHNNYNGIQYYVSDDNVLYDNRFTNNDRCGIYIDDGDGGSHNNLMYFNFFLQNIIHAIDDQPINYWNNSYTGNYWDNHTSPDTDPIDGIVDIPYNISGLAGSKDYLPLAEDGAPRITINSPHSGDGFGITAPSFDVEITDIYVVKKWYTLDGGVHNYTFTENGMINQSAWDEMDDGTIKLTFYASDIVYQYSHNISHIGSADVALIKDAIAPVIIINSPAEGERFGKNAPLFNISVTEDNLDGMWYSFDGGAHVFVITNNTVFNQTAWTELSEGDVTITFYARDIAGNEATETVSVIKSVPSGLDPGMIITIIIVSIVGGVAVISVVYIFMKKRTTP